MNSQMLSRLVAALTPDSTLARQMMAKPIFSGPIPRGEPKPTRASYTKNKGRGESKIRRKMARESRRRNRR